MKQKEEEFKKGQIAIRKEDIWKRPKKRRRYEESDDDDEDENEDNQIESQKDKNGKPIEYS